VNYCIVIRDCHWQIRPVQLGNC